MKKNITIIMLTAIISVTATYTIFAKSSTPFNYQNNNSYAYEAGNSKSQTGGCSPSGSRTSGYASCCPQ